MKGSLKDKLNSVKENVKGAWDKASEADKSKIKQDIKDRNLTGVSETMKENFRKK